MAELADGSWNDLYLHPFTQHSVRSGPPPSKSPCTLVSHRLHIQKDSSQAFSSTRNSRPFTLSHWHLHTNAFLLGTHPTGPRDAHSISHCCEHSWRTSNGLNPPWRHVPGATTKAGPVSNYCLSTELSKRGMISEETLLRVAVKLHLVCGFLFVCSRKA